MKKLLLLFLSIQCLLCTAQSADRIIFDVRYKPSTDYSQTIEQISETTIKYGGSPEMLERLATNGMENPMVITKQSTMESLLQTKKQDANGNFPLTITMLNTLSEDGKVIIPNGTIIYGKGTNGKLPTLDSIVSKDMDSGIKKMLLEMMQGTFSQMSFPVREVKIGESFSSETPLSIPIAGYTLNMGITTNYKLLNIINGIAELDIVQTYTMDSQILDQKLKATGSGKGRMFYDVKNNFYERYQVDTEMEMNAPLEQFDFTVKSKSGLTQTIRIQSK